MDAGFLSVVNVSSFVRGMLQYIIKHTKYYYNLKQNNNYRVSVTCGGWNMAGTFFPADFIILVLLKQPDFHAGTKHLLGILISTI